MFSKLELITLEERITPATFTVTNNNDSGVGSLRQAIIDANVASTDDNIVFTVTGTITLNSSLPSIVATSTAGTLTITGPGASNLNISGNNGNTVRDFNIFNISQNGNLDISRVTVSGAQTFSNNGGAFNNNGELTVSNSTISGNTSRFDGGGIFNAPSNNGGAPILNISNSIISGNSAESGGGIFNGRRSIRFGGGGPYINGFMNISNSTISGNSASRFDGGGIKNYGISNISSSTISSNTALAFVTSTGIGGGISIKGGTLTILNSNISGNSSFSTGGGIYNKNQNGGNLTISNSTISGNTSGNSGGGIFNNASTVTVSNCTISGNISDFGGGISSDESNISSGPSPVFTITNSTIFGNFGKINGGGIDAGQGTLTVSNCTISDNAGPTIGGGGISQNNIAGGTLNIANTIIANSKNSLSVGATTINDYFGSGAKNIVNLIPGSSAANNLITKGNVPWATTVAPTALNLGPLQNNGGSTSTMALGAGSVAIGTASAAISNAPPINGLDQRGVTRSSTAPSIGAYEAVPLGAALNPTFGSTTSTADGFTVQITNYDPAYTFIGTATANGMVSISNTGFVTVTGVAPATSSTATITTTRTGYNSGSGTITATSTNAAALNPTFGATTSTIDGFTVQITNYDPLFTFRGTATANGIVSISNTGLVTVTGLASGTSSTATITTTRFGYNSGSGMVTASSSPGLAALNPTFGVTTSTLDGFTVQITNYNAAFTFSGTATANGVVSISNTGFVTVTGVAPGTSSTATIITNRIGYNSGSGAVTATSNVPPVPLNPTFGTPTSTPDGFTVQITNYDAAFTFGGTATAGGRVSINGTGLVTVNGVAPGTSSTATITTTRSGYGAGSGSITAFSANGAALTPTFGTPSPNANGFTVQITNYDRFNYIYGSSASNGSVSINGTGLVIVTGLPPITSSTVTIVTIRNGYNPGSGTITASSGNGAALNPTFGTPTSIPNGFIVQITNYDSAFNYSGTATANGFVSISGTGLVNVTGIAPGTSSTATITTSRANYNSGSGTIAGSSIYGAALNPTFGTPSSTTNGFIVQITNYNSAFTYSGTASAGGFVSINGTGIVTVTGVAPSTSSTVFIDTMRFGYNSGYGFVAGTSTNGPALIPTFGSPISTTNGFNVQITNYDPAYTFSGTATANGVVSISNTGFVTVTGVAFPASSIVTITATRQGYSTGSSSISASAGPNVQFAAGTDSGGGPVVMVKFTDGSSISFFAYDPAYTGGVRVALGDLNGDGTNEVICGAGAGGGPNVRVFTVTPSRATMVANFFAFEPVFKGGVYVAAGNLDGNVSSSGHGIDDLIVSAGPGGGPRVIAFSGGANYVNLGSQLCDYFVYAPTFRGGVSVAAGNVFGGVGSPDEIITGAGPGGGPHVRAFQLSNTNTPNSVLEFMAFDPGFRNGINVSAGDISGDGIDDIFAGANAEPNQPAKVNVHQSNGSSILLYPFGQVGGGARVGVAMDSSNNEYMVVGAGPGSAPLVQIYNRNIISIDSLFVFPLDYLGGVFVNTSISN